MTRTRSLHAMLIGVLAASFVGLTFLPAAAPTVARKGLSREEEIANIKQQIADLQKRLQDLQKPPVVPTVPPALPAEWTKALNWRCIGPSSMGGRIVALAVYEADPTTYWVATASGGLLKTTNNGTTFAHQFDKQSTVSIGDVAVAQSNKNVVWVGTGENNPRNSVSYGDGVYKSTDGGDTWVNVGLKKSFQIGRIVIHPKNPDVVYVGALGRLYGPNEERGLYKTTDGGKSWTKLLHVDDNTGVIDVQMHPTDPETLLVATWERRRDGFDSHAGAIASQRGGGQAQPEMEDGYDAYDPTKKWGKGGAIYKTTDGGKKFTKITKGLPTCELGRIGIDYYRKDPKIVYAIIDCEKIGSGPITGYAGLVTANNEKGARVTAVTSGSPAETAKIAVGDVVTAIDKTPIKTANDFSQTMGKTKPNQKVTFSILRGDKTLTVEFTLSDRPEVAEARRPRLGFDGEETPAGLKVTGLFERGAAVEAGLLANDVIVAINKKKITKMAELLDAVGALEPGVKFTLSVQRGKDARDVVMVRPNPLRRFTARPYAFQYGGQRPNVVDAQGADGHEYGGVYRSDDGGESWKRVNSINPRPMYFSQVRVDPSDDKLVYVLGIKMWRSSDAGKTFEESGGAGTHDDEHAMWINPRDGRHVLMGTDGGTYVTYDRCRRWDYLNHSAVGQFYHVCVDNRRPYRVYGGMQDNGSWGGPSRALDGRGPVNSDWGMIQGGDGFVCRVDPNDSDVVYAESQEGNVVRHNVKSGESRGIKPRAAQGQQPYRFNWNTPFIVSQHNSRIVYVGGNYLFQSVKRGDEPKPISPELTRTGKGSASAVAESPRSADVLWVGTDDGNLWVSKDAGKNWENVISKLKLPKPFYVATIEPSREVAGRCYVCFDGHRSDDDEPHVYVTEDYGQTWKSRSAGLPTGSSRCLREDLFNPNVLYLGTEFAAFASIDYGETWTKINNNLPTVAIHEIAQHPTSGEIVVATHGRSIWILDATPLRQLKPSMAKEGAATLLEPNSVTRWRREPQRGTIYGSGHREYYGENPQPGAHVYYALTAKAKSVELQVQDVTGKTLAKLQVRNEPGLHRATWNMITGGGGFGGKGGGRNPAAFAPAGQYRVVLKVDGKEQVQGLKLENDPALQSQALGAPQEERKPKHQLDD